MIAAVKLCITQRVLPFIYGCFGDRFGEGMLALFSAAVYVFR